MDEARPVDYGKSKVSVLQRLAAGGVAAALRELQRRGIVATPAGDVTRLDYRDLRALVIGWRVAPGDTAEDLARRRDLALRAHADLLVRHRVMQKHGWRPADVTFYGPDQPALPVPPWEIPRPPRVASWQRPQGSTLYPSEQDIQRAALNELARAHYKAAGVPQQKETR